MDSDLPVGKIDWLASYPKSGNTWMRMLLSNYFSEQDDPHDINKPGITNGIASSRMLFDEFLGVDSSDLTAEEVKTLQPHIYKLLTEHNRQHHWLKVHDAQAMLPDGRWLFPPAVSGSVVYLIRNPLDVTVSLAFHDGHEDMDRAVSKMCNRDMALGGEQRAQLRQFMGSWSDHVRSWTDQSEIPVLVVRYEDMLADTISELERVIAFARPAKAVEIWRLEKAVRNAAFDKMQTAESETRFRETPSKAKRFFRNGKAGDWKNHLSNEQVNRICECHVNIMKRFNYGL